MKKFESEQIFDMLPYAVEIYEKVDLDSYAEKLKKKYKNKKVSQDKIFWEVLMHILKNSQKVKDDFFSVLAIAQGITLNEAKKKPIKESFETFKAIIEDNDLMGFLKASVE
ncbi:hypothetical protein [Bacillus sp. 2205SS5-2]|uniref:hypothetical protein n=1 Tax=Bacillus sp. 2205SS5-2 TaxID=3109031 RepID=UPI0030062905